MRFSWEKNQIHGNMNKAVANRIELCYVFSRWLTVASDNKGDNNDLTHP